MMINLEQQKKPTIFDVDKPKVKVTVAWNVKH